MGGIKSLDGEKITIAEKLENFLSIEVRSLFVLPSNEIIPTLPVKRFFSSEFNFSLGEYPFRGEGEYLFGGRGYFMIVKINNDWNLFPVLRR